MTDSKKTFPSLEDWKAPWEKNGTEFDADTAKKLIYNMERNAFTATESHRAALEAAQSELTSVRGELETAKGKVNELEDAKITDAAERARVQMERQMTEMREMVEKIVKGETAAPAGQGQQTATPTAEQRELAALRAGLSAEQAKRLQGSTLEELEADAKELRKELGLDDDPNDFVEDGELFNRHRRDVGYDDASDHGEMPRGVPTRTGHRTNLAGNAAGRGNVDPGKARDLIPRR